MMLLADMMVLFGSSVSCSYLFLIISIADSNCCEKCSYIIGSDSFSIFHLGVSYFICKFLTAVNRVDGFTNQACENSCFPICHRAYTGHNGPQGGISFLYIFGFP